MAHQVCGTGILNPAVAQIFTRRQVYDNLFSRLAPGTFAHMAGLCRAVRAATTDFATRAYDIDRSLNHYFSDPLAFRKLMARTYLVISGSFALQFFNRTSFPGSDLDLYIHHDVYNNSDSGCERILEVGRWLESEGYVFKPASGQQNTLDWEVGELEEVDAIHRRYGEGLAIADVYTFEKKYQGDFGADAVRKVQLVIPSSDHISPLETILHFHSTCVMNVITHNAAYSLYPYATFELKSALVLTRDESARTKAAIEKYASRGFRMLDPRSPSLTYDPHEVARFFPGERRRVDDGHSWIVPFTKAPKLPQSVPLSQDDAGHDTDQGDDEDGTRKDERMRRESNYAYGDEDCEDYECDNEEYDDEDSDFDDDNQDEDQGEDDDRDPIPECRWRLCGDALPLRVRAVDYVGARNMFWDE